MMIVHEVSKRGVKIDLFRLKLHIIKHMDQYKHLTREETGKVGPLYYLCIGSYIMALVFGIIYLILLGIWAPDRIPKRCVSCSSQARYSSDPCRD